MSKVIEEKKSSFLHFCYSKTNKPPEEAYKAWADADEDLIKYIRYLGGSEQQSLEDDHDIPHD